MTRSRSKNGPYYGGTDCSGSSSSSASCNTNACLGKNSLVPHNSWGCLNVVAHVFKVATTTAIVGVAMSAMAICMSAENMRPMQAMERTSVGMAAGCANMGKATVTMTVTVRDP